MNKTNIRFAHIAPTAHLDLTGHDIFHMTLGHLVQEELVGAAVGKPTPYIDYYRGRKENHGCEILMDNSAFEIIKHGANGGNFYSVDEMITLGTAIDADILVMTDFPGQPSIKTVEMAKEQGEQFKAAGFRTMFVPQSEIGDTQGYIDSFRWAVTEGKDIVDLIGVSILGVPNALGDIEKDNKLQRFLARWKMMQILDDEGLLDIMYDNQQGIHMLGAVDGWLGEIRLMEQTGYDEYIYSWDTSQAVWHGLLGIEFDNSPTGLLDGKNPTEVDFSADFSDDHFAMSCALANVMKINRMTTKKVRL